MTIPIPVLAREKLRQFTSTNVRFTRIATQQYEIGDPQLDDGVVTIGNMASAAGELAEPQVLAHTKRRLFPEEEAANTYAVVDTQFSTTEWLSGQRIDPAIQDRLAPFNHVRVGGGYPDLVGVRNLESELLAIKRFGDDPPLVAVEAKGQTGDGTVDTQRGILQAYDRLQEANAAYLAAPAAVVTQTDRTLARELNVEILGVDRGGDLTPLEVPRVVGNRTTGEVTAIRF